MACQPALAMAPGLMQGRDAEPFDRSTGLLISRLRQRLRDTLQDPRYIGAVRNEGCVFCAERAV